jgi:hypothetical protein
LQEALERIELMEDIGIGEVDRQERAALRADLAEARDKALLYDLDRAGITQRNAEAVELVELRADLAAARAMRDTWQARYTVNAEHLKHVEADLAQFCGDNERLIKATGAETVDGALVAIGQLRGLTVTLEISQHELDVTEADLARARAVLDSACGWRDGDEPDRMWVDLDRAAWLAWTEGPR